MAIADGSHRHSISGRLIKVEGGKRDNWANLGTFCKEASPFTATCSASHLPFELPLEPEPPSTAHSCHFLPVMEAPALQLRQYCSWETLPKTRAHLTSLGKGPFHLSLTAAGSLPPLSWLWG